MIRALGEVLDTSQDRVLVIDDGSPDGTGEIADRLAAELGWVSVLHRETKEGIGPAYIAGFRQALADGAELVLEMDCDFSHDPADVPRLIAAARGRRPRSRVALRRPAAGPRTGASCDGSSRAAAASTRRSCWECACATSREASSAFGEPRSRRSTSTPSPRTATRSRSRRRTASKRAGLRIREVPITFVERRAGASKMTGSIVAEAMWKVPLLRLRALVGQAVTVDAVGAAEFESEVLASPIPVIVDFWAPWCRPCEAIEPHLRALADDGAACSPRARERRRGGRLSGRYGVLSLPTVILFAGGEPKATVHGAQPRARFEREFSRCVTVLPSPMTPFTQRGRRPLPRRAFAGTSPLWRDVRRGRPPARARPDALRSRRTRRDAERFALWNDGDDWELLDSDVERSPTCFGSGGVSRDRSRSGR